MIDGKLIMVTKRLDWYKNKFTSIFGGVGVYEVNGYYVFVAEKRKQEHPRLSSWEVQICRKTAIEYMVYRIMDNS